MEKFDIKKVGIILAIIVVIVIGIFLIGKVLKNDSVDKKTLENYETKIVEYYLNLSAGFNTPCGGSDALYAGDETKLEDLSSRHYITAAIEYINKEKKNTNYDKEKLTAQYKENYPEIEEATLYNAETIKKAIKTLFGIDNFTKPSIAADVTYLTNYIYIPKEDLYMVYTTSTNSAVDPNQSLDHSIIDTVSKDDKIITTVAIAYRYLEGEKYIYASDRFGENVIVKSASEFPKDKISEFDKYEFTLSKTKDGKNYVFESVKKVK